MERRRKRWRAGLVGLGLVMATGAACSSSVLGEEPVVEESSGELGQGVFRWQCVDDSDPTCGTGVFPRMVAVGARFDLAFTPHERLPDEITSYQIVSVSSRHIDDGLVRMRGEATMLATGDGFGVDYIVLDARPVDRLVLRRVVIDEDGDETTGGPLAQVEVTTRVEAVAYNANDLLAGSLEYEWDNLTPTVVEMFEPTGNQARLRGLREGTARLTVRAGDHAEIIEVTVTAAPEPDPTTGGEDTDGGSGSSDGTGSSDGSGSGTDGDTGSGTEGGTEVGTSTGGDTDGGTSTGGGR